MQETNLQNLVINKVENQEVYDALNTNGDINDNELYLVGGDSSVDSVNGQTGDVNLDIPVVHKVESQDAYDEMVTAGQINDGELYLVQGDEYVQYTEQTLTDEQKAQARENIDAISYLQMKDAETVQIIASFNGNGSQIVAGSTDRIMVALAAAPEDERVSFYQDLKLTNVDYPLFGVTTSFESGGTVPSIYGKIITASGRIFVLGGSANLSSSWTPREVFSDSLILESSTENSTKKFKITVDDSGTISATEIN